MSRDYFPTSRLGVTPVYYNRDACPLSRYRTPHAVQVSVSDLASLGTVVALVTASGANRVNGISFGVDNTERTKDRARAMAPANARAKADQRSSLAGGRIVGLKSIAESDPAVRPVPTTREAAAPASVAAAPPPPVEPGTQEVRTQVLVVYVVE